MRCTVSKVRILKQRRMEAKDSYSCQDSGNVPELKECSHLLEEIKHVDEYVKEMHQLIKDEKYASLMNLKEAYNQNASSLTDNQMKQELSLQLENVKQKLRTVNEKYFTGKSGVTLGAFGLGNYDSESVYHTPVSKLPKSGASRDEERSGMVYSSVGFNSDLSLKEVSLSSSSSSDSESDSDRVVDKHLLQKSNGDVAKESNTDSAGMNENSFAAAQDELQKMKQLLYEKFVERVSEYEKQLKAANEEIENSQEEISRLERKLTVGIEEVTRNMQSRLDSAHERVRVLEGELDSERRVVSLLEEKISRLETDVANRDCEIGELNLALNNARESFSEERSKLLAEVSNLSEKEVCSMKKLKEAESKVKSFEEQMQECEAKMEREKERCEGEQKLYLAEIELLKQGMSERCEQVEKLNRDLDASRLNFDMLIVEKDEQAAKMEKLGAEMKDQGIQIKQMEARISQLEKERTEMLASSEERGRVEQELRVRVDELVKEMDRQSAVLFDRAEEKREAIRQLCFSLEYYRTEYYELCRVFSRKKRQPVVLAA